MSEFQETNNFDNAKKLVKNILTRLCEDELTWDGPYRFVCHNEFDSNTTDFESLSNARLLPIKTKFRGNILILLTAIFQAIYDDNYWKFYDYEVFYDIDSPFKYEELEKFNIVEPDNYPLYMAFFLNMNNEKEEISEKRGELFIGENEIHNELPKPDYKYAHNDQKNFEQKVYTIEDILHLFDCKNDGFMNTCVYHGEEFARILTKI